MHKCRIVQLLTAIFLLTSPLFALAKKPEGMPPAIVEAASAKMESWQPEINAVGTLNSNQGVTIKPEISGRVTGIYFRSGQYIKAGTPLMQINQDILKAELIAAQAQAALSAANYQRGLELYKRKIFAKADLDKFVSSYQADQANVAKTRAQLDQSLIRAPFSGKLGLRMVNLGDYVNAGNTIITNLDAIDPLRVDFKMPEVYLSQIKVDENIAIQSSAYPNQLFHGKVYAFDSKIDPNTRTLGVRATLPNPDKKLLPGAFVDVTLETGKPQQLVTLPETAISVDAAGSYAFKVVEGKAVKVPVRTGARKPNKVAILSGIHPNEIVITEGSMKVRDGAPVMVKKG